MIRPPEQLSLPISLRREPTLAGFLPGANAEALGAVAAIARGTGEPYLFLFGGPATGKTHLLQAAVRAAAEYDRKAQFIPLGRREMAPSILDDLETRDLLAIDDLQVIAGRDAWELAVFDLFNRARAAGCALLIAAAEAPDRLGCRLPDLRSRLLWGPAYRLAPLDDDNCERLLAGAAADLGLRLGREAIRYIMNNHARDPASLLALLETIDRVSLRRQRQPTIPLVREILKGVSG